MQMMNLIVSWFISVVLCFLGIKLYRVGNGVVGALAGATLGWTVTRFLNLDVPIEWGIIGIFALLIAVFAMVWKRFGVFIFCMIGITGMLMFLIQPKNVLFYAVFGGIGMLFAIAAMQWTDAVYILATAFTGGVGIGHLILQYIPDSSFVIRILVYVIPVLIGCGVQFLLKSRELGRKEAKFAEEMKRETSMEKEVEQARSLMENDLFDAVKTEEDSQEK